MRSAEFKFFPWGLLALAMPVLAAGAALGYSSAPNAHPELTMSILLSVLAAGNAYILAIAGGRLSNAVLSIPVGAVVGFVAAPALSVQPLFLVYLLVFGLYCVGLLIEFLMDNSADDAASLWLMLIAAATGVVVLALAFLMMGSSGLSATSPWAVPICYPVVMSCIGAAMVVRTMASGAPDGFITGFRASAIGMLYSGIVFMLLFGVMTVFGVTVRGVSSLPAVVRLFAMTCYLMLCNYFTLRSLFPQWLRASGDSKRLVPKGQTDVEVVKAE